MAKSAGRLARTTGGEIVIEDKNTDLIAACRQIAKDIRNRYTIGFRPLPVKGPQSRKLMSPFRHRALGS